METNKPNNYIFDIQGDLQRIKSTLMSAAKYGQINPDDTVKLYRDVQDLEIKLIAIETSSSVEAPKAKR